MEILFSGSIPKHTEFPDDNEDYYCIDIDKGKIVICDGASESFDSKRWASIVGKSFMFDPIIDKNWIRAVISKFEDSVDINSLSWSKQASHSRGSFTTLIGIDCTGYDKINIVGIGDSLAVHIKDGFINTTFPYKTSEEFSRKPILLSTIPEKNNDLFEESPNIPLVKLNLPNATSNILLIMTDALGEWFMKAMESNQDWRQLAQIRSTQALEEFVISRRINREIRIDDSTLLVVRL